MGLFSDSHSDTVFKNEEILSPEYLPQQFPHREDQIQVIADTVKPALHGRRPHNSFIFGPPGVGKTAIVRYVFSELEEFEKVAPIYINCWEYNTRHAVLSKILNGLGGIAPRRGVATDEVFDHLIQQLEKKKVVPVIALDEVDQLIAKDGSHLFYDLLRYEKAICILAISNDVFVTRNLDARVKSSLAQEEIIFKPYTELELKDIVRERIKDAFRVGKVKPGVLEACSSAAEKQGGDVRFALECLWKAGREADKQGSTLTKQILEDTVKKTGDIYVEELISSLSEHETKILKCLSKGPLISGDLYQKYSKSLKEPVADRTFRNYISRLETLHLIDAPLTGEGVRGKSRMVSLRLPVETLEKSFRK